MSSSNAMARYPTALKDCARRRQSATNSSQRFGKSMNLIFHYPRVLVAFSLVLLWVSERTGASCRKRWAPKENDHQDLGLVATATLTLLGLIIGFTFSMAINRYEQRKNYEEEEANAIGTEYLRADLLPAADAVKVRALLRSYLEHRIAFYE